MRNVFDEISKRVAREKAEREARGEVAPTLPVPKSRKQADFADEYSAEVAAGKAAAEKKRERGRLMQEAIAELNKQHALVLQGSSVVVLRETVGERLGKELLYMNLGAFRAWHLNHTVPVEHTDKEGKTVTRQTPVADLWLKAHDRRQYEGVTFAPANNAPSSYYNLWTGFAVDPLPVGLFAAAMKCRRLLAHMKYVLCNGSREHFRYLLAWAADMVQDPDRKKGVALVMRGLKGVGKSTFTDVLGDVLGRHQMKVSHMRHLVGNFNRHLADKLLITAEESYWAGDKSDEGPLKDMITSGRMVIEAKGVDSVEMPSLCRVAMITNNEWAAPASADERRYFVLDVSDKRRQDFDYFAAIHKQMGAGGRSALLTVLQRFPLGSVNLRKVPETGALRQQREYSLQPHDQFVLDALTDGVLAEKDWASTSSIAKDAVYDAYIEAARKRGKQHLLTKDHFCKKFMTATGAKSARPRAPNGDRLNVFRLPPLQVAAETFSRHCGVDVEPPDDEEDDRPF